MSKLIQDWNPETYARFRGLRLRPAMDLLMQVPALPPGDILDLGCGDGAVGPALGDRFQGRRLIGVDSSAAMLTKAEATGLYDQTVLQHAASWRPENPIALIFANALCHWLFDHDRLFPNLAAMLVSGGTLAIQMPRQQMAPSHKLLRDIAAQMFPASFDYSDWKPQVAEPDYYRALLTPLGDLTLWETEYHQTLDPVDEGHPIRHFTQSTAMRIVTGQLTTDQMQAFTRRYDAALTEHYPLDADGAATFPFRRLFFVLTRPGTIKLAA